MRWPSAEVLGAVRQHADERLVGTPQFEACQRIAQGLRGAVASYYLECRLDGSPQVDFLLLTTDRFGAAADFEGVCGPPRASVAWQRNLNLLRGWAGEDPAIDDAELVWFEYDVDQRLDAEAPLASLSLCVERNYMARWQGPPTIDTVAARRRANGAVRHLVHAERRAAVEGVIDRCLNALPEGGSLVYVSEMLTRSPVATKLYVALPKQGAQAFLQDIAWPGELGDVRDVLGSHYRDIAETVFLDLSVTERLTPRLGFAFSQLHQREMSTFDACWSALPMTGVPPEKREALASWPGETEIMVAGSRCNLRRWLDIKLVLNETRGLQYKAYLGFKPALRRPFG